MSLHQLNKRTISWFAIFISTALQIGITMYYLNASNEKYGDLKLLTINLIFFVASVISIKQLSLKKRHFIYLLFGVTILLQLAAMSAPPSTSTDSYRYYWDGKVQVNRINPYSHAPSAKKIDFLRDDFTFFKQNNCPTYEVKGSCTNINRPNVRTIYPPASQVTFSFIYIVSQNADSGHLPYQIAGAIGSLAIAFLIMKRLAINGSPLWPTAIFAWCPIAYMEFVNNAHIDWLGIIFALAALSAYSLGRYWKSGVYVGLAFLSKFYPAMIAPVLIKKKPIPVIFSACVTVIVFYFGYVLDLGSEVLGYLPGYLDENQYDSGERFFLLNTILPSVIVNIVAVIVFLIVVVYAIVSSDQKFPERSAILLVATSLLITTPTYGWYGLLLLSLICITQKYFLLPLVIVMPYVYLAQQSFGLERSIARNLYIFAAILTSILWGIQQYRGRRRSTTDNHDDEVELSNA